MNKMLIILVLIIIIVGVVLILSTKKESYSDVPTMHDSKTNDFYNAQYVCNSPWSQTCVTNDGCAQFGIGEICAGPEGAKFCVCASSKDPLQIQPGGVCTDDSQCTTGNCSNMPGQFSKMCICPQGQEWSMSHRKCINSYGPSNSGFEPMWDPKVSAYPAPPANSGLAGNLCGSTQECSVGSACTPDNFCASQVIPSTEKAAGKFEGGAKCTEDRQCTGGMGCVNNVCTCPYPTVYNFTNKSCQCPDGSDVFYNGKCVKEIPRELCPSIPGQFFDSAELCGLGEQYNPSTRQCMCVSDLGVRGFGMNGLIGDVGRCTSDNQCKSGKCASVSGVKVCVGPTDTIENPYLPM